MTNTQIKRCKHEIRQRLVLQDRRGESKHEAKLRAIREAHERGEKYHSISGIYSNRTMERYIDNAEIYVRWCDRQGIEGRNMEALRPYVREYIRHLEERERSAWTINAYVHSLCAVYGCKYRDLGIERLPARKIEDIHRTRQQSLSDLRYQGEKYDNIREFLRATGARREGFERLRPHDIKTDANGDTYVYLREKGGKERWALVHPDRAEMVRGAFSNSPGHLDPRSGETRVFAPKSIPKNMTCHNQRALYCQDMYRIFEERGFGNGERYEMEKKYKEVVYDKGIVRQIALMTGHSRCSVVCQNYMTGYDFD